MIACSLLIHDNEQQDAHDDMQLHKFPLAAPGSHCPR